MSEIALPNAFSMLMTMYGYFLPIMLYAAWSTLGFVDLGRRSVSSGTAIGWIAVIVLVPFFGALAYHLVGGSTIPTSLKRVVVGGGLACIVLVLVAGRLVGAG